LDLILAYFSDAIVLSDFILKIQLISACWFPVAAASASGQ
jgi:hypothetical protein